MKILSKKNTGQKLCFPFHFDVDRLKNDLARIPSEAWIPHFNSRDYAGEWLVAPLRSQGGRSDMIFSFAPHEDDFKDTELLRVCGYFQEVLRHFRCKIFSARLLNLTAGSTIKEHTDDKLCYEEGMIRVHIPIQTGPDVFTFVGGEPASMAPGEVWYMNFHLPHKIENRGESDRIHMVLDLKVNAWLDNFFQDVL